MTKERILLVEEDEDIAEVVQFNLGKEGWRVEWVEDGDRAIVSALRTPPLLILLDLLLPEGDGLEVCRVLRASPLTAHVPLVMMTSKSDEMDIVRGLELGADDYLTKPFSPMVLVARIRSILRRKSREATPDDSPLVAHDLRIDPRRHEVSVKGKPVSLTSTEFRIVHFLARHAGWVFTQKQIVDALKRTDASVSESPMEVQMVVLHKNLGKAGDCIETLHGVGYRFLE